MTNIMKFIGNLFGNNYKDEEDIVNPDIYINLTNDKDYAIFSEAEKPKDDLDLNQRVFSGYPKTIDENKSFDVQEKEMETKHKLMAQKGFFEVVGKGEWDKQRTIVLILPNDPEQLPEAFKSGRRGTIFLPYIYGRMAELDILKARQLGDRDRLRALQMSESLLGAKLEEGFKRTMEEFKETYNKEKDEMGYPDNKK